MDPRLAALMLLSEPRQRPPLRKVMRQDVKAELLQCLRRQLCRRRTDFAGPPLPRSINRPEDSL